MLPVSERPYVSHTTNQHEHVFMVDNLEITSDGLNKLTRFAAQFAMFIPVDFI
jgi:hypothetical protein